MLIVLLILAGSGYFVSKMFLREQVSTESVVEDDHIDEDLIEGKKVAVKKEKKSKAASKGSKKSKKAE